MWFYCWWFSLLPSPVPNLIVTNFVFVLNSRSRLGTTVQRLLFVFTFYERWKIWNFFLPNSSHTRECWWFINSWHSMTGSIDLLARGWFEIQWYNAYQLVSRPEVTFAQVFSKWCWTAFRSIYAIGRVSRSRKESLFLNSTWSSILTRYVDDLRCRSGWKFFRDIY